MTRFYVEYTPIRRGLTGREFLAQHLDETFPEVSFTGVSSNGFVEFGFLEGSTEQLCNVLNFCERSFAIKRLFIEEFRGAIYLYSKLDNTEINTLFSNYGIMISTPLSDAKAYKSKLLKEVTKKQFNDYNDLVANLTKEFLLLQEYKTELTISQTERLNSAIASMKTIYDVETCLKALEKDVEKVQTYMPFYYSAKLSIENSTSIEDLQNIDLVS
jgi:hypothetical protein